jgi:hypothetical protein
MRHDVVYSDPMTSNNSSPSNLLPPEQGIVEEGDESGDLKMRDSLTTNTIIAPSGKYKRTPSIPVDMLENRSSPSVVELDLIRKKRQQENQLELFHGRDFFLHESMPRAMNIDSDYNNRNDPLSRLRQSPPVLQSFARKSFRSALILPMRRQLLSPPKILVGQGVCQPDDRFSEMMMSDSDDFLLRFPNNAADNTNFFVTLDRDDYGMYSVDDSNGARPRLESLDDLCIQSSSTGFDGLRDDILRCRSTSPVYRPSDRGSFLSSSSKITLKPKLRNMMLSSPYISGNECNGRKGSPPNLSSLHISKDSPIKPRARHFQPAAFPEGDPSALLAASYVESLAMEEDSIPAYLLNEASPFRLVSKSGSVTDPHSIFASIPPADSTPSYQNTPFSHIHAFSTHVSRASSILPVETPWSSEIWNRSVENSDIRQDIYVNAVASGASDVTVSMSETGGTLAASGRTPTKMTSCSPVSSEKTDT